MSQKMSTGLCNQMLDTNPFKTIFAGCFIDLYDGMPPATADAAATGTKLARVSVSSGGTGLTWGPSAGSGIIPKTVGEVWTGLILASSTATYYRIVTAADDATLSTTQPRIQGSIATGGADMNLGTTALVNGATFTVSFATQSIVPS